MNSCDFLCQIFSGINWWMFALAVLAAYGISAVWYSLLFSKKWVKTFKVEMTNPSKSNMVFTMAFQFLVTAFYGLLIFLLSVINIWLAAIAVLAYCAWEMGSLKFQFGKCKDFKWAALINVGNTFVVGLIFFLLALIR